MQTFYHVSGEPLASGLVLEPGRFGHAVRRTNSAGGVPLEGSNAMVLIWETALETARQLLAPGAPSRSGCVFAMATLGDARAFRDRFRPGVHIYEVTCSDEMPTHRGDYDAITDPPRDGTHVLDFMPDFAINYWRSIPRGVVEVLIGGPTTVVRRVDP
jgi:hypothetical protein